MSSPVSILVVELWFLQLGEGGFKFRTHGALFTSSWKSGKFKDVSTLNTAYSSRHTPFLCSKFSHVEFLTVFPQTKRMKQNIICHLYQIFFFFLV